MCRFKCILRRYVEAMDLMRQGIDTFVGGAAGGGDGGGNSAKRSRAEQESLMEVPTGKKLHEDPGDDFGAVPDAGS